MRKRMNKWNYAWVLWNRFNHRIERETQERLKKFYTGYLK